MRGPFVLMLFMALGFNASGFYWCAKEKTWPGALLHGAFTIAAIVELIGIARGKSPSP